ncbi:TetR/AcrR family transcriptional regulator, partial [Mycobacterium asiaticum]
MTRSQLGRPVGAVGGETRERIIAATMRCVAQAGYSRATIREIARTADVTGALGSPAQPGHGGLIPGRDRGL